MKKSGYWLVPRHPVGQVVSTGMAQCRYLAVVDLGRNVSRDLQRRLEDRMLTHGAPFESGGVLQTASLPLLGAGATVLSSLSAGNVFLATANPATLMQIGSGVGSAVMGPTGIVMQAPFISASSAILPVVAPVMFFMTFASMLMSARFDAVQNDLSRLSDILQQLLRRETAGDHARFLSATKRLEDIRSEFGECRCFTDEMKMRLVLVERDINELHHKFRILAEGTVASRVAALLAAPDQRLFVLSSLMDIQVDALRLQVAIQENPDDIGRRLSALDGKIAERIELFGQLLDRNSVKGYQKQLSDSVTGMSWWARNVFRRKEKKDKEELVEDVKQIYERNVAPLHRDIDRWREELKAVKDSGTACSVVYYRERAGKGDLRSHYTSDVRFVESS